MRPYATSVGALSYYYAEACGANASETQEIAGNVGAKHGEKMQEDARKCGDLLLVAEAMLEIVNNYNRESFPPLGVRIGALFACPATVALLERTKSALLRFLRAHLL